MNNTAEQPLNLKASAWTIGVHVVLLLLLIFVTYTVPATVTPVQDLGMEVNLGTSDNGSGTDQPMAQEDPAPDAASVSYKTSASENAAPKEMMQTDEQDAPEVSNVTSKTQTANNNTQTQNTKHQRNNQEALSANNSRMQRPRYVYNGGTGRGGNGALMDAPGSSEGNTTGNGDRGVPGGTPGAANYTGVPGNGNGISYNLARRTIVAFPPPDANFREGGRVTVRVTVNREGVIVNKQIISAGNAEIRNVALHKVDKIRFNKSDTAPEEQFGTITFVFKTRS